MVRRVGRPSPTWRGFLRNQAAGIAAIDMFVVVSASFQLLYVMIILAHDRRRIVRFDVTKHPTAIWLSQQITEAFPWDTAPRYLLRDRDASYGTNFRRRVEAMGIVEVITAPRSPWQNAYVERVIGSIRREYLNHLVIFNERHLAASSHLTSIITIAPERIFHWIRIAPSSGRYRRPKSETSSPSLKSVVCTIATSASRRDPSHSHLMPRATGATSSTHLLIETFPAASAGSNDRFRSQLLPHATTPNDFALAPAQVSVQIEFSAGTGICWRAE